MPIAIELLYSHKWRRKVSSVLNWGPKADWESVQELDRAIEINRNAYKVYGGIFI